MSSVNYSNITLKCPHITMIGKDCVATGVSFNNKEQIGKVAIQLLSECENTPLKIVVANIPEDKKEKAKLMQTFEELILSAIQLRTPEKTKIVCYKSRPSCFLMEVGIEPEE